MSYTIERIKNPPAYIVTLNEDLVVETELAAYTMELCEALDEETEAVCLIVDLRHVPVTLSKLMAGTKEFLDLERNPNFHPNTKHNIIVSDHKMMKLSMDGFFKLGLVKTAQMVNTVEEAIELVRQHHDKTDT